ncbi:hypothetical protein ACFL0Y_02085 [Patescibacteria group bacterium]
MGSKIEKIEITQPGGLLNPQAPEPETDRPVLTRKELFQHCNKVTGVIHMAFMTDERIGYDSPAAKELRETSLAFSTAFQKRHGL